MNKVITINLHGNAYQLEEAGYDALQAYLDNATRQLANNPDKDEIIADIEQAIADKCRALLSAIKTVVTAKEIDQIIAEMGPVDGGSAEAAGATGTASGSSTTGTTSASAGPSSQSNPTPGAADVRRLYRIREGRMVTGVCNGIGAYLGLDPTVIRVIFVLLAFVTFGGMILAYAILTIALPVAETAAEKAAAHGVPQSTAQDFIRRAREGYYDATRSFGDKAARREWKRNFKREMRQWRSNFRREMYEQGQAWRATWPRPGCATPPPLGPGWWIALPIFTLVRAALILLLVFGIISLASSGTLFGLGLPHDLPIWLAIVLLILFYNFVAWPIRAIRYATYQSAYAGPYHAVFGLIDAVVGIGVAVVLVWFLAHHSSDVRDALHHLPATIHHGIDAIKEWWSQK